MRCPYCGNDDTRVSNSRPVNDRQSIRRRRICDRCGGRFTTFETIERVEKHVIKRDGSMQEFDHEKLKAGIRLALEKRPVDPEKIEQIANEAERQAFGAGHEPVQTDLLGKIVLAKLKETDRVAYLRFASVYKDFSDLTDFEAELKSLQDE